MSLSHSGFPFPGFFFLYIKNNEIGVGVGMSEKDTGLDLCHAHPPTPSALSPVPLVKSDRLSPLRKRANPTSGGRSDGIADGGSVGQMDERDGGIVGDGGGAQGGAVGEKRNVEEDAGNGGLLPLNVEWTAEIGVNGEGRMQAIKFTSVKFNGQVCGLCLCMSFIFLDRAHCFLWM